jgi:hypothetical protein
MTTFAKTILSGSTDGKAILIASTSSPGTTIHTGSTTASTYHEVWCWVQNTDTTDRKVTIEWGGTTSPNDLIEFTPSAEGGLVLAIPGLVLKGNSTALVCRAFAATANVVTTHGYVHTIAV